jgi:exonuclease III
MSTRQAVLTDWWPVAQRSPNEEDNVEVNHNVRYQNVSFRNNKINHQVNNNKNNNNQSKRSKSTNYQQQTIHHRKTKPTNSEYWGDEPGIKHECVLRIACRNINYLPMFKQNTKNEEVMYYLHNFNIDVLGMCETNLAWHNLPEHDRPKERFRGYFNKLKMAYGNNLTDTTFQDTSQIGGTMLFSTNDTVSRINDNGTDKSKLGRWTWFRLQGRQGITLRIVSVYRPVYSTGVLSTYQQHRQYLLAKDIDICPRQAFFDDLDKELQTWFDEGDQIIIMGDFNEDVRSRHIKNFFGKYGMTEMILRKHGQDAPNTYCGGTVPIDGIFVTANIIPVQCGYTAVNWGTTCDHRLLWADLSVDMLFGNTLNPTWTPSIRKLKLIDPRIVDKFLYIRKCHLKENNLSQRLQQLYDSITDNVLTIDQQQEFESIDQLRAEGMLYVEKYCRKLRMGSIPWSPELQTIINTIRYLRACQKKFQGRKVHARHLCQLKKRSRFHDPVCPSNATELLRIEYMTYNQFKKDAKDKRIHFLEDLAGAISIEEGRDTVKILAQLQERERIRELSRKLKAMKGENRARLMQVEVPLDTIPNEDDDERWRVTNVKEEIELGCKEENSRRFPKQIILHHFC